MAELRRAPGMRERSPGVWEIYVDAGRDVVTGARRRISRTFRVNLREAKKARTQLMAEASRGRHDGTRATVEDLCAEWLHELDRKGPSPNTISNYRRHYEHDIRPTLGKTEVTKVTTKMLTDMYGGHQQRGLAPGSIYQIHATISAMMSQACRWGWRESNPAQWAEVPGRRSTVPTVPTPGEVLLLIEAAKSSRRPEYARAFFLAATTGIRRGEVCSLRCSRNVDWDHATISVTHNIIELTGAAPFEKEGPKNLRHRSMAVDPATLALLAAQRQMMTARASAVGAELITDPYLFSDAFDGSLPWRPGAITRYFARLRDRAGLPHLQFKHFRKFMETYGRDLGFSLAQVALRAGHDPAVASRHYTGRVSAADRALAEALASLLAGDDLSATDRP